MHDDRFLVEERLGRVLRERIRPAIYATSVPMRVERWDAPGEPVPVADGLGAPYESASAGDRWGPPWGTTWFRLTGEVPQGWAGQKVEAVVDLGFDIFRTGFQCEGLVYTGEGDVVKGLNPRNAWVRVADAVAGGERVEYYVEAAANPTIDGPVTPMGDTGTAGDEPLYRLARADLAVFDEQVWELVSDLEVLDGLMRELGQDSPRRWEILRAVEAALDAIDLWDVAGTAKAARQELDAVLTRPAEASAHRLSAVGHAHIDSAWLWPLRETVRKVARTAANVVSLMDSDPDLVFAMSQAQQLAWIKEHRPEVYAKVRDKVADGRFVPVGGMWVESDTNMPGGEAMARQFVTGKRFYLDEFGIETEEVWLPDSFGYSAGMPQLVALSGSRWFLTQKISWSQFNKFPHHTFWWEGLDGTRIFTHFPPIDTYNAELSGRELAHAVRNFQDKGHATRSLVPFGYGDGGGGPTREMLARARRTADLEGSPRVVVEAPSAFFAAAEEEYADRAPVWSGELYLELHRGTYTSQAQVKRGNRHSEHLLREAELWATTAAVRTGAAYPYEQLDRLWKVVLLHQFHDILPGSSISWVNREARDTYGEVAAELERVIGSALGSLAGEGTESLVFNAAPHPRDGVAAMGAASATAPPAAEVRPADGGYVLVDGHLRVEVDAAGLVTSIHDRIADREVLSPGAVGNLLQLHPDLPNAWDAWDVDAFYRNTVTDLVHDAKVTADGDSIRIERTFGSSRAVSVLRLAPGEARLDIETEVDWHEREKFLKLAFPLDVHADRSAAETQFGHVFRNTHTNTGWDAAKFEICAHRFVHVGEPSYGVALVNDATYGHDVSRTTRPDGGTTTTVRASLLRAPRFPDPETDQGVHRFRHALVVGAGVADAVREGYRVNLPPRVVEGAGDVAPLVSLGDAAVVVEAVKLADDRSGDVVVRLYESLGGRAVTTLATGFALASVTETDLLERPLADAPAYAVTDDSATVRLRPFQILTLRLSPA
ncbi:MAG: alpha-mannosidase [Streptosporangiales bacterium]|nr:alpha-mannosidase [Streptosporangiales bacterium]